MSRLGSIRNASKHSVVAQHETRLSIIAEDETSLTSPPLPFSPSPVLTTHYRSFNRFWGEPPPRPSYESAPPLYSLQDVTGPKGEKLIDVRNNRHVVKRGGWKRLCLGALVLVAVVVGLAVGLALGLRKRSNDTSTSTSASTSITTPAPDPAAFPAGSYSLTTYLYTTSANCTANPSTYSCPPYMVYNPATPNPTASRATFNWIITWAGAGYNISATNTPFTINFSNASLSLADSGTANERYIFSTPINVFVTPSTVITSDGSTAGCWYNSTLLTGSLYTKKPPSWGTNSTSQATNAGAAQTMFTSWPYAVDVEQTISGGLGVPSCFRLMDNTLITMGLSAQSSADVCRCGWKNFGT